jgi:hypothetical protein
VTGVPVDTAESPFADPVGEPSRLCGRALAGQPFGEEVSGRGFVVPHDGDRYRHSALNHCSAPRQVAVVRQPAGDDEFAAAGSSGYRGGAGVALQRIRPKASRYWAPPC